MRKISGVSLKLILLFSIFAWSLPINGLQTYQPLEKYLFTRIIDIDAEWNYSLRTDEYRGTVTIIKFNLTAELWNSADEILAISYSDSVPYFIHMLDLESNENTILNQGSDGIDTEIDFIPGLTLYHINATIINKYIFERYPPGNYEIYFGEKLHMLGNAYSVFLEITENNTIFSYDDIPSDWGATYDITLNSSAVPTIAFLPTMPFWIAVTGFIVIHSIKRFRVGMYRIIE